MDTVTSDVEEFTSASHKTDAAYNCKFSSEEVSNYYTEWAEEYEKHLKPHRYRGPAAAAEACSQFFPDIADRQRVKILDVAAGTGLLGQRLKDYGFCKIDAIDPSEGMLELARKKNIYTNYFCEFVSGKELPISRDTYDAITLSGGMGDGHIPPESLHELIRVTRPGGYIIIAMREAFLRGELYENKLEPLMQKLVEENRWKLIDRMSIPNYSFDNIGVLFKFKVV